MKDFLYLQKNNMGERFSERIGKREKRVEIQVDYIEKSLRNKIWNVILIYFIEPERYTANFRNSKYRDFIKNLWFNHFGEPLDEIPDSIQILNQNLRNRFFSWGYLDVYDFLNFIGQTDQDILAFDKEKFIKNVNIILERELSGYRFVGNLLSPITNEHEIQSIEDALSNSNEKDFKGVYTHISSALEKLSDRKNPDYRNSIKESISAVESICQQITGNDKAELSKTLNKLNSIMPIHGALEKGFKSLYGYTSDEQGIRHAMMEETNLQQEDALFMLVSCSSFVNYLIVKANKLGILKK